jgi:hypothetical protein
MSRNSILMAEKAKKDKRLLGSTNQPRAIQPKTYSKVERVEVQIGKKKHREIKGFLKKLIIKK